MGKLVVEAKRARWEKAVSEWCESGENQRAFCQKRGLPLSTFQWWRRRLKEVEVEPAAPPFLPILIHGTA
jgi:hypothetical protein